MSKRTAQAIAAAWERQQHAANDAARDAFAMWGGGGPTHRAGVRVGRNDPCPCKSGKKFKKCCIKEN